MALADWVRELSHFTQSQIERACGHYLRNGGRRKPLIADIVNRIQAVALSHEPGGRIYRALPAPEPERDRVDGDIATDICNAAGFTPKRFQQVKKHPMANSREDLEPEPEKKAHWSEGLPDNDPRMVALRKAREENPIIREAMGK